MDTDQTPTPGSDFAKASSDEQTMSDKQMLLEIYENTRKAKNYMKWQLYITIILIVIPLLAAIFILPFAFNSLSTSYGSLLQ